MLVQHEIDNHDLNGAIDCWSLKKPFIELLKNGEITGLGLVDLFREEPRLATQTHRTWSWSWSWAHKDLIVFSSLASKDRRKKAFGESSWRPLDLEPTSGSRNWPNFSNHFLAHDSIFFEVFSPDFFQTWFVLRMNAADWLFVLKIELKKLARFVKLKKKRRLLRNGLGYRFPVW